MFINYIMVTFKVYLLCLHTTFQAELPLFVAFLKRSFWDVFSGLRYSPLDVFCLGTNFSHPHFFSQYPTNGFQVHFHFINNHFDC